MWIIMISYFHKKPILLRNKNMFFNRDGLMIWLIAIQNQLKVEGRQFFSWKMATLNYYHRSVDGRRILVDIKCNDIIVLYIMCIFLMIKKVKYWMECWIGKIGLCMWKYMNITQKKYVYNTVYSIKKRISVYVNCWWWLLILIIE